jgi:hypothetical protein
MSKTFERRDYRVTLTQREMRERQKRREAKRASVSESAHIELLDRSFDYQRNDIFEMLNMRRHESYAE